MRRLWISRINAAAQDNGMNYSNFINGLKKAEVTLNRKVLADIAVKQPEVFSKLAELSKSA